MKRYLTIALAAASLGGCINSTTVGEDCDAVTTNLQDQKQCVADSAKAKRKAHREVLAKYLGETE